VYHERKDLEDRVRYEHDKNEGKERM